MNPVCARVKGIDVDLELSAVFNLPALRLGTWSAILFKEGAVGFGVAFMRPVYSTGDPLLS